MTRDRTAILGCLLIIVLLCVDCSNCPYFDGHVESVMPTFVIGLSSAENSNELTGGPMVVVSDILNECVLGHGLACALTHDNSEKWWAVERNIPCRELMLPSAEDLRSILDGRGYVNRRGPIPLNKKPLKAADDHWGYHRLTQGKDAEYYIRYNDTHIRVIEWTSGNRWGTETDHTYSVQRETGSPLIETVRSEARQAALERFPEL